MSVKIEKLENNMVQLDITVDAAVFETSVQKSFIKNSKKYEIHGFRKGKAPRNMIERIYGEGVFFEDALEDVIPAAFEKAVEENNIETVDRPEYDFQPPVIGEDVVFTAKVTVKPEVVLGAYTELGIVKEAAIVSDEEVETEINKVLERNSRLVSVEDRPVQSGDNTVIDFEGFMDGVPFEGGKGENYPLVIGSNSFIPGFEEQLIGAEIGTELDVNVTFPEDYGKEDLAGMPVVFKCKVNEIKFKELPTLDDEFAKDVSEFDTLEEYKKDFKANILKKNEENANQKYENECIEKIVEGSTIDLPQVMIERRIDALIHDMDMKLKNQGLDVKKYMEYMGMNEKDFREQHAERADKEVRAQLCIEKISQIEAFEVSQEEIDAEIEKIAQQYKQSAEDLKKQLLEADIEYIKKDIQMKKTIDFIATNK